MNIFTPRWQLLNYLQLLPVQGNLTHTTNRVSTNCAFKVVYHDSYKCETFVNPKTNDIPTSSSCIVYIAVCVWTAINNVHALLIYHI